jgi:hypothetical protein
VAPHERTFKAVVETVLKSPEGGGLVAESLDLDTGRRATNASFGENDRETHPWVREHKLDLLGVIEKAIYHVTSRLVGRWQEHGDRLFRDQQDFRRFEEQFNGEVGSALKH